MSTDELPEDYKRRRAADEVFWHEQERNIQGALGQPCCTLSGIASGLLRIKGRFAIVVHGEDECAGCFRHMGPGMAGLFCTGLTEQEFVTGKTAEPLRRCLEVVSEELQPEAIFVLGACPVEVIGDRFEVVVAEVNARYPQITMVALHTSGLKVGSQTAMLDWMFESLATLPPRQLGQERWRRETVRMALKVLNEVVEDEPAPLDAAVDEVLARGALGRLTPERSVVFVGLPMPRQLRDGRPEHIEVLQAAGLRVLGNFPGAATLDDWRAIKVPRASFVADRSLYPRLVAVLEASGQAVVEVPLPVGIGQTDEFFATVGRITGQAEAIEAAVAPRRARAQARLDAFKARFGGLRLAYGMRMNNNYNADELAYQGLGDYPALAELGFDVTLVVQGPPDKRGKFATMFERRGVQLPFEMFAEPWVLGDLLRDGAFKVACVADHCRSECQKAGAALLPLRSFDPYYEGVVRNCDHIERVLGTLGL
jgi:hypothetical protein